MGPDKSHLSGRNLGNDFQIKDGFRMYHGETVPGFPAHPHLGFETVTIARKGYIDHTDSLGAAGRFGEGDVQWMTAGKGVQHAEMFPLVDSEHENHLELFQIWLNLPKKSKKVDPHFAMLWSEDIPRLVYYGDNGKKTSIALIAGQIGDKKAPAPAPNSWAADPSNEVAIWTLKMEPNAQYQIPSSSPGINKTLYFFKGLEISVDGKTISPNHAVKLQPEVPLTIQNGNQEAEMLFLQGKPIGEPVVQYGPFVVNNQQEIQQVLYDFQSTQFGGWPWPQPDPVHPREKGRFARFADGEVVER